MSETALEGDNLLHELQEAGFDIGALQEAVLYVAAGEGADQNLGYDVPMVLPALNSWQQADILARDDGRVMIFHDRPMPQPIWWAEYDPDYSQLIFVTVTGQVMGFGQPIHAEVDKYLRACQQIILVQVDEAGAIQSTDVRRIVVRKNGRE